MNQAASKDAPPTPAETPFDVTVVLIASMLGVLMQTIDTTIVNVSLPYMQGSFSASREQITWILTSYLVAAGIGGAPIGWLAGRFGKKWCMTASLVGFTLASILCGAAQTLEQVVIFRIIQGLCGSALQPLSQAIILDLYPPHKRTFALSIWSMALMVGPIMGPTLGGYLTDAMNWRWIFYVNVPFGIAAVIGIWTCYKTSPRDATMRFDWFGFSALVLAVAAFQLMMDRGTTKDWFGSSEVIIEAVLAGVGLYLFVVHMATAKKPLYPVRMLKDRNLLASYVLSVMFMGLLLATTALLPSYLQNLGHYTVLDTGLVLAPRGLGALIVMPFTGPILARFDPRIVISLGLAGMAASLWEISSWTPDVPILTVGLTILFQGMAMGITFLPINILAFSTIAPDIRTDAVSFGNIVRMIGAASGISLTSTLLFDKTQALHSGFSKFASTFNHALDQGAASLFLNPRLPFGAEQMNHLIEVRSLNLAYADVFRAMAYVAIPAIISAWLFRKYAAAPASKPRMEPIE